MSRLLLDANVSPALAEALRWRGHDAVHVRDIDHHRAPDGVIFELAAAERRAIVTHDDDYLRLLRSGATAPSVIHLAQRELQRDPVVGRLAQAVRLGEVLHRLGPKLPFGIAVRVGAHTLRVDPLPLSRAHGRDVGSARRDREIGSRVRERGLDGPGPRTR